MWTKPRQAVTLPSGSTMPLNGFGTWKAGPGECAEALRVALDVGYRHIDLSPAYMNEPELGVVLEEYCAGPSPKIPREQLFITSKLWNTCHARPHVMEAIKRTLLDLRLSYLDLYLVHHPFAFDFAGLPITKDTWVIRDESSPFNIRLAGEGVTLEQTWRGMEDVLAANLTHNIGISNYNAALIMDMCRYAKVMPAVHQFEAHAMFQRSELVDLGNKLGIHSTMYSILGSGKEGPLQNQVVAGLAAKYNVKPAAICIAWGINQGCCVLAKSIKRDRIHANFDAENVALDSSDLETLKTQDCNLRTLSTFEYWGFEAYS